MPKNNLTIFEQELEETLDKRTYRIMRAASIDLLEGIVEIMLKKNFGLLGGPFECDEGYCQAMVKMPKERVARQSIA